MTDAGAPTTGTPVGSAASGTQRVDGRSARRARGKIAVLDAALRRLRGDATPTTEMLASEAGISTTSLFRYFDGLDDLYRQLADHFVERYGELFAAAPTPGADRPRRIDEYVRHCWHLADTLAPLARSVDAYASDHPEIAPVTLDLRQRLTARVERYFTEELATLPAARRSDVVAAVDVATSMDARRTYAEVHRRTPEQTRRAWIAAVNALLPHAAATPPPLRPRHPMTDTPTPET